MSITGELAELLELLKEERYEQLYADCLAHGEAIYEKESVVRGRVFNFVGIFHLGGYWLFEFHNGQLTHAMFKLS